MVWFEYLDILMWVFFFLCFVAFYWSGTFQFSRYFILFDILFRHHEQKILLFIARNRALFEEMDKRFSRHPREVKGLENVIFERFLQMISLFLFVVLILLLSLIILRESGLTP